MRQSACLPYVLWGLLTLCLSGCAEPDANQTDTRPNIVWITVEDMSPRLAAFGDTTAATPNIDRLASEGVRYTNVYSISGVCAPSRAALITGMYPTTIGAQHMRTMTRTSAIADITDPELLAIPTYEAVPPPEVKCFTEYLRAAGYYCTNNPKEDYQFRRPITAWDASGREAHCRNRINKDAPFFAVFNSNITHESQVWQRADEPMRVDPSSVELPPYYPDHPVIRRDLARHYSNIELMDQWVGSILEELEEANLLENTIIFFFSDHGDGLPRMKRWVYDSGLHVPLIVKWPDGRGAGTVNDELVSFVDFAPTMLSISGQSIPDHLQGQAFPGDQKAQPRSYIFAARDRMDPAIDNMRAVRDKRYKYIRNYMPERPYVQFLPYRDRMDLMKTLLEMNEAGTLAGPEQLWVQKTKPIEELYDTETDPHEVNNLASDPAFAEKLAELRAQHERWKAETNDWGLIQETELKKRLWPPNGVQPVTAQVTFEQEKVDGDKTRISQSSPTEGAPIAYAIGSKTHWSLYTAPLELKKGEMLYARAIRIGYAHSPVDSLGI